MFVTPHPPPPSPPQASSLAPPLRPQEGQHGAVPSPQLQWWYLTGHLWDREGLRSSCSALAHGLPDSPPRYGIQLTHFLGERDRTMGLLSHAAESDLTGRRHSRAQRIETFSPQGPWDSLLARVLPLRLDVTHADWRLVQLSPPPDTRWHMTFSVPAAQYTLLLEPQGRPWLHGNAGFLEKLPGKSNYYYSQDRILAQSVRRDGATGTSRDVCGLLWFDREVDVNAVDDAAWTWLALRFRDNSTLMISRVEGRNGTRRDIAEAPGRNGASEQLVLEDFTPSDLKCLSGGRCYFQRFDFRVRNPRSGVNNARNLRVESAFPEQEMTFEGPSPRLYWEGSGRLLERSASGSYVPVGLAYIEQAPAPRNGSQPSR